MGITDMYVQAARRAAKEPKQGATSTGTGAPKADDEHGVKK